MMTPLKIKVYPEDFIVEEKADLPLERRGEFGVYALRKSGWNTLDVLKAISRRHCIPLAHFAWGGRKDRHARTTQFITIRAPGVCNVQEENFALDFVGRMDRPMGPDLISGNHFVITVRQLAKTASDDMGAGLEAVARDGVVNYFDDQRFGSFDPVQGFFGEKVLKQQFNGAAKIYLTAQAFAQDADERRRRQLFFDHWRDWDACATAAQTPREKKAFAFLQGKPTGFLELLKTLPREELSLYFSAYQSFLWNAVVRRLIEVMAPHGSRYGGAAGDYLFCGSLSGETRAFLNTLAIPTPGAKAVMPDERLAEIYNQVLAGQSLEPALFNRLKLRQAFFKTFLRPAVVRPGGLRYHTEPDERYPGFDKLVLEFLLPRGSYATMVLKRLSAAGRIPVEEQSQVLPPPGEEDADEGEG